jgi:membrane associated rhomboid family serine protease
VRIDRQSYNTPSVRVFQEQGGNRCIEENGTSKGTLVHIVGTILLQLTCKDTERQTTINKQAILPANTKMRRNRVQITLPSWVVVSAALLAVAWRPYVAVAGRSAGAVPFSATNPYWPELTVTTASARLYEIRGGATSSKKPKRAGKTASLHSTSAKKSATGKKKVGKKDAEKPSALSDTMQKYKQILPLTRVYITMVAAATILGLVLGEELAQGLLALDPIRTIYGMELWRPITAACFLGLPSIGWLLNGYYLFQYGSTLERAYGTPQHCIFLLSQLVLLSVASILTGQPFFASSMITAMLHVLSRSMPHQKVKWLVFTVPYWSLPYGLMVTDVLQAQSAVAALPHVLGILSGHFYHFHKFVWPKLNGEDWLVAPTFLTKRLDADGRKEAAKEALLTATTKKRKGGGGRKLGSSSKK